MLRREVQTSADRPTLLDRALEVVIVFCALRLTAGLLWMLCGCSVVDDTEHAIKGVGADIAEVSYCEFADCGQVFLCETTLPYGDTLTPELCWMDDDAAELARALSEKYGETTCAPTPRGGALGWPCLYCCGSKCGRGANAYQGSFCS